VKKVDIQDQSFREPALSRMPLKKGLPSGAELF